jgi:hypothetical protein
LESARRWDDWEDKRSRRLLKADDEPASTLSEASEGCSGVTFSRDDEEGMAVLIAIRLLAFASGTVSAAIVGLPPRRLWESSAATSVGRGLDPGEGLVELGAVSLPGAEGVGIALDVDALLPADRS